VMSRPRPTSQRHAVRKKHERRLEPAADHSTVPTDLDAIVVLPAGIKQAPSGRWVSTDLTEEDDLLGAPGGKLRVDATAILARLLPATKIITGGARGFDLDRNPSASRPMLAEVLRNELLEAGISEARILLEWSSNSTFQELQQLEQIIGHHGITRIAIITNRWHLARLKAMLDVKFEGLRKRAAVFLVAAENILIEHDPARWRAFIRKAYQSGFIQERLRQERQGIAHIYLGQYRFREDTSL
jgi:hypothetical protein